MNQGLTLHSVLGPQNASRSCPSPLNLHSFPTRPQLPRPHSADGCSGSSPLPAVVLVHSEDPPGAAALKLLRAPESRGGPSPAFLGGRGPKDPHSFPPSKPC